MFHFGLAKFSVEEFEAAGIDADDRFMIEFMADQEVGHAKALTDILGRKWCLKSISGIAFDQSSYHSF